MGLLPQFERSEVATLVSRLEEAPRTLIFVYGPRQCGKTTLVLQGLRRSNRPSVYFAVDRPDSDADQSRQLFGSATSTVFSPDSPTSGARDAQWLLRIWERAREEARRSERGFTLVLDEIHFVPKWHRVVKGLWDSDRINGINLHVVLLASAPLLLHSGITDALAGRFEVIRLTHWSYTEMSEAFNVTLKEYVHYGGYPGVVHLMGDERRWRKSVSNNLVEPALENDVLALQRVDKPALLRQLFEVGARYSGQIVSYTKMLGRLQDAGNTTTLARYLHLLSKVDLLRGLDKYAANVIRRRASKPKLQVLNTALMSIAANKRFEQAQLDRSHWGRLVESAVGAHLCSSTDPWLKVYYWREGNYEVDFVLRLGDKVVGIEVKSGDRLRSLRGLEEFGRRFAASRLLTVGAGGMPLEEFLQTSPDSFLDDQ